MSKTLKVCTRCNAEKELTEFYDNKRSWCNSCERETAKKRMQRYNATFEGKAYQALNGSRRTARKYGCYDDLTLDDVKFVFTISGGRCVYCGKVSDDYQLEHCVPLSKFAPNTISNITVSCRSCNMAKNNNALFTWYIRDGKEKTDGIAGVIFEMARNRGVGIDVIVGELKEQAIDYMQTWED